jgi:hypothetical protein
MLRDRDGATSSVSLQFNRAALIAGCAARAVITTLIGAGDRAIACVSGRLRPPPDPWLESALRRAFAELDRDLMAALQPEQAACDVFRPPYRAR